MKYEFIAPISKSDAVGSGAFVNVPEDVYKNFQAKGQVKVCCEFDGEFYRGSIVNMGAGHCIGILKSIRGKLGKGPGDNVKVVLWKDEAPREVEVPKDFAFELSKNDSAKTLFETLSYTNKKQYVDWITAAKRSETREKRIIEAIALLENDVKNIKK